MKSVQFFTVGCKVNQYETQALRESFENKGYELKDDFTSDIYIINTCHITSQSDLEAHQIIRKISKVNPQADIIVTGCAAQAEPEIFREYKTVRMIVGNEYKNNIANFVEKNTSEAVTSDISPVYKDLSISRFDGHTRAFVKIQDGCNEFCSFCTVPFVRGKSRSRSWESIIKEIETLIRNGYQEIVLTAPDLGDYLYYCNKIGKVDFLRLLKLIVITKGLKRLRLSSIQPKYINSDLLKFIACEPLMCKSIHLSLQSGDDEILKSMNRKYTVQQCKDSIDEARKLMPEIAVSADIIVGYPTEADDNFKNTCDTIRHIKLARAHIFRYSPRKNTVAFYIEPKVDNQVAKERSSFLKSLVDQSREEYISAFVENEHDVLVETKDYSTGLYVGLTDTYVKVFMDSNENIKNKIVKVRIKEKRDFGLVGTIFN